MQKNQHPKTRAKLIAARIRQNWTQQQLADLVGTTSLNVGRWERGMTTPSAYYRHKLCEVFSLNAEDLDILPTLSHDGETTPGKEDTAPDPHVSSAGASPLPDVLDAPSIARSSMQDQAFLQVSRNLRTLLTQPLPGDKRGGNAAQNRANMLVKLQRMYDDLLDDSLQKLAWIELPLVSLPDAVHTPANLLLRRADQPPQPLAPGTTVQQVYQQANQELLILGEPGAGKSTLLYYLGRDLLAQAQQPTQPLPVVFPLSSWTQKRLPLQEWMIEQLCSPLYEVPRGQSQQWVQNQHILPLLDGLDEVKESARPACIAAINAYRSAFPLCPLVVCSRSQEYDAASQEERLHLYSAIEVQPLTEGQQEEALQQAGTAVEGLRAELTNNEGLRELTSTPFWLNVLLVATRETPLPTIPQERSALQQEVLRRYVQRMCERKGDAIRYPLEETTHWLGFLASQMRQRNQMVFALEELQPDWLAKQVRRAYRWSVGLIGGMVVGLVFGLIGALLIRVPIGGLVLGLVGGLVGGLIVGLASKVTLVERFAWSWEGIRSGLVRGLVFGLTVGLVFGLVGGLARGLAQELVRGLVQGLAVGLVVGLVVGLTRGQVVARDTSSPGKGLSRSLSNGLLISLVVGLVGGLGGLVEGLVQGPVGGLIGGLVIGLVQGLGSAFQHLMIRFWLARADRFPLLALAFLHDACERAFLKRVGGTYRFIHRLVLDYFADLSGDTSSRKENVVFTTMQKNSIGDGNE